MPAGSRGPTARCSAPRRRRGGSPDAPRRGRGRRLGEALGRREDDLRRAGGDRLLGGVDLVGGDGAVQLERSDAALAQLVALVLHQRDQRRDDERRSRQQQGRKLVAERLAGAGRHHRQGRLARHHVGDRRVLSFAQPLQPEGVAKDARQASSPRIRAWLGVDEARRGDEGMRVDRAKARSWRTGAVGQGARPLQCVRCCAA